jgi:serine/threonine protein kinase
LLTYLVSTIVQGNLLVTGLQHAGAINEDQPMTGHFGYLYNWYAFKAPEIDNDFVHDKSVDLWSFGVIIYVLLTGMAPFSGEGDALVANKHAGNFGFEAVIPSEPAQRLVTGLLQAIPENRLTIEQVLDSEWMIEADDVLDEADLYLTRDIMTDWNTMGRR